MLPGRSGPAPSVSPDRRRCPVGGRRLVREPELLLAAEPFGALDALTRLRMHALLRKLCERHGPAVLQRRGLFRTEYTGRTLRENDGLARPANRNAA